MAKRFAYFSALFALLVMLSGTAHALQHDVQHDILHETTTYEHSCLQADASSGALLVDAMLPPVFVTDAPHLPRTAVPHQAHRQTRFARGPPHIL